MVHAAIRLGQNMAALAAPPSVPTTFDPALTAANITLSGGNLTAAKTNLTNAYDTTQSLNPRSSLRRYVEVLIQVSSAGSNTLALGLSELGMPLINQILGFTAPTQSIGFLTSGASSGIYSTTGGVFQAGPDAAPGDVVCFDMDLAAETLAYRINGGAWSAPVSFANMTPPYYFTFTGRNASNTQVTANFGASAFAFAPPVGAVSWNT